MEHLGQLGHDGGASAFVSMGKMSNNVIVRADPAHQQLVHQVHPGLVQQHPNGLVSYANGGVLDPLTVANGGVVDASKTPRILIIQQNQQQQTAPAAAPAVHYQHPALVAAAAAAGPNTPKNMSKKRKSDQDGSGHKRPRHKGPPPPPATGHNVKAALPSTTTLATAGTDSEQRAIRNSYVTDVSIPYSPWKRRCRVSLRALPTPVQFTVYAHTVLVHTTT